MKSLYRRSDVEIRSNGKRNAIPELLAPKTQSSRSKEYCFDQPFYPQFLTQLQGHGILVYSQPVALVHSAKSMESEGIEA